ncbi:response regulator transcription factor [bacterium]|nr:response regulator transcription factor [bacterium]
MCKIAILENYALFSSGIKAILIETDGFEIVGEAKSTEELLFLLGETTPDVIIIDILHFDNEGIRPLKKIKRNFPHVPILLIIGQNYAYCFEDYLSIGVKGFIFKDACAAELTKAVKKLSKGEEHFRKSVWEILKKAIQSHKSCKKTRKNGTKLTDREISVLKLFCQGLTFKEIGLKLYISPRTVEAHKKNILSKINVRTTAEMVKFAIRHRIEV